VNSDITVTHAWVLGNPIMMFSCLFEVAGAPGSHAWLLVLVGGNPYIWFGSYPDVESALEKVVPTLEEIGRNLVFELVPCRVEPKQPRAEPILPSSSN
jgi:hypothetical protein